MGSVNSCETPVLSEAPVSKDKDDYCDYAGPGPWYTCKPDGLHVERFAKKGPASREGCVPTTLPELLKRAAETKWDKPALKIERPLPALDSEGKAPESLPDDQWKTWTWKQHYDESRKAAKGFIKLGHQPFDAVAMWGFNAPEWMCSTFAAMMAGGMAGGLYPTDTPETAAFKVAHSGASIVVFEDKPKLDKLLKALAARQDAKPPRVKAFVTYGYTPAAGETVDVKGRKVPVLSWSDVIEMGGKESDGEVEQRTKALKPGQCAVLVYTSGTTGDPKAVMLSHDNVHYAGVSVFMTTLKQGAPGFLEGECQERLLSYLPLSHIAGMAVDITMPAVLTALSSNHMTTYFARPYDMKAGTLKDRLCAASPTLMLAVPLVWEKIADKLRSLGAANSGLKQTIGTWAKDLGLQRSKACLMGGDGSYPTGYTLADMLVLSKVKAALGLDQLKYAVTGAAPIRVDTLEYFGSLGLDIHELYGMSESHGCSTISTPACHAWGSCGFQIAGLEVKVFKVDHADINKKTQCPAAPSLDTTDELFQGEICFRGRTIMMGYMAQPDFGPAHIKEIEKKTAEAIDAEGWMHTGDKGIMTDTGMVKITGRFKELIIGDGGENIAPVPIEDHVKAHCDGINEVMMVGDKRKYNVALITLKAVGANGEVPGTDDLDAGAKRVNPEVKTISAAMDDKVWIDAVTAAVTSANNNGKCCPNNAFKIQKFMILPTNFSEDAGYLTPTKKLKRPIVEKAFIKQIEQMYSSKETYVGYQP